MFRLINAILFIVCLIKKIYYLYFYPTTADDAAAAATATFSYYDEAYKLFQEFLDKKW